ncbi:MAG TPA: universal stress protein [Acidobacteriaceae bacterium]|nr:universal stress protein [Acidobacteriaceae bacterium]
MDQLRVQSDSPSVAELRLGTYKAKFKTILLGVDFSGPVITALNAAKSIADQFGGTLFLVHAVPPVLYGPGATPELLEVDLEMARAKIEGVISKASLGSIPRRTLVEFADPTDLLDEVARAQCADLIVVGSHGAEGLKKLAFGSVAESVLRRAPCPVLVIGPHCRENLDTIRSIVFATDLETSAFRPAQYASSIAEEMNARLTLLHVRKPGPKALESSPNGDDRVLLQELRQLLPADAEQWCEPKVRVEVGNACEEVLRVAQTEAANLIVVGVRESSTLADHSLWSTLSQIIRGAECPVLAVRGHLA